MLDCRGCTEAGFTAFGLAVHALFTFHPSSTYYNFNCISLVSYLHLQWDPLHTNRITHLYFSELQTWLCYSSTITCQVHQVSLLVSQALLSGPIVPPLTENGPLTLYHFHLLENLPQKRLILLALNEACEQFGIFLCNKKIRCNY